ncbi:hypothetical protein [Niabella ginsengisoli]|uniref:Uncharacterized protein n=1 Tax=Niabella ginsengisoli TaxID=522298 RepID=A0ABS9SR92_9BACT|nr:hypothetical protein [Niabella ginsengisoli]MCH5600879.1 hypothetical protein [Niabella ginsengisoli]
MNGADSSLIQNVIATASFINSDPFWSAQVAQLGINNCGQDCWNMEMVPVVGNHTVDLGDGSDIASKFHRLYLFYDQVLKRTGFDKYQKIDVQYSGQVIGVEGNYTKVDSIQLRKNIENLLQQSRQYNEMVQVAPSLNYDGVLQIDTSAEAQMIYQGNDVSEDSIQYLQNNEPADDKKQEVTAAAAIAKSTPAKEVKPTVKNNTDKQKSEKKPVAKKTDTKKDESKTGIKKGALRRMKRLKVHLKKK